MKKIYFDNAATTQMSKNAIDIYTKLAQNTYANAASLHGLGLMSLEIIDDVRKKIASALNCKKKEIYFTSGGTESNNIAILGSVVQHYKKDKKIITTCVEHPSVYSPFKQLEGKGFNVTYLQVDKTGKLNLKQLEEEIDEDTILISVMLVNNEVGTILPVERIKEIAKKKKCNPIIHTDAVQAFLKMPIDVEKLGVDLLSITAHKIGGPKGIGALYKRSKTKVGPVFLGGDQEDKLRPGTQPVELIGAFGAAVDGYLEDKEASAKVNEFSSYAKKRLQELPDVELNSQTDDLPNIINFSIKGLNASTVQNFLSSGGVYVSAGGSACAKGKNSRVLTNMGFSKQSITGALRVSFSGVNTKQEIDILMQLLEKAIKTLVK